MKSLWIKLPGFYPAGCKRPSILAGYYGKDILCMGFLLNSRFQNQIYFF
jgi:hypothetical protein